MPIIVDLPEALDPDTGLQLCQVYLNAADNPADFCAFRFAGESISITSSSRAEVRQLIGRRRIVRTGTEVYDQIGLDLRWLTSAQQQWLRDHVAQIVCVRDHVGTKVYGAYLDLPREISTSPMAGAYVASARVSLDEITFSEAV
jgi:hypothetical protein